jgi:hypothetical protein
MMQHVADVVERTKCGIVHSFAVCEAYHDIGAMFRCGEIDMAVAGAGDSA